MLKMPRLLRLLNNKGENPPAPSDGRSGRGEGCPQGPPSRALYRR